MPLKWRQHPVLQPPTEAEMARMEPKKLMELWEMYHAAIENAERDPYRYGFVLPHWKTADEQLERFNEILVSGGNRCVDFATTYVTNADTLEPVRFDMVYEGMPVFSLDETTGNVEIGHASAPFVKGVEEMIRVEFSNGSSITCTPEHRMFLEDMREVRAGSLSVGERLLGLRPRRGDSHFDTPVPCAHAESGKAQDSQSDYQSGHRFCDERPPKAKESGLGAFPSPNDARKHTGVPCNTGGVVGAVTNSPYAAFCQDSSHESQARAALGEPTPLLGLGQRRGLNPPACIPSLSSLEHEPVPRQSTACKTSEPVFPAASREPTPCAYRNLGGDQSRQMKGPQRPISERFRGIVDFSYDEIIVSVTKISSVGRKTVWDLTVGQYGNYLANGVFHHNSAKTSYAARAVVRAAIENPGAVIMCFSQNADVSVRQQQSAVYDALPEEYRKKTLGAEENVSYTRKNGFSKASLILPGTRSQIIFKTYAQFLNNDTILEGAELGSKDPKWINIGAWCDEYLIGPELLATLRFRLATRNAKMIVTFTPIDGYTEVVRDYREGAKTVASKPAELLNNRLVPTIQHSKNRNAAILYFHTKDNPFGGYERIAADLKGRPEEEILTRAYGIPTKSYSCQFPNFSQEVNVIPHDKIPKTGVTRYMALDPAGAKNWFMVWLAVDATDTYYVYREWPDVSVGDWAKWHGGKWILGPGAKGLGYGIKDYVDLIKRYEDKEEIFERLIDPRMGAAKYQAQDGASSIIEDLAENGMIFVPAPGLEIDDGIQALQSKMAYDRSKPMDGVNRPKFYVSDRCENLIWALQEYTGEDRTEPAKDVIDTVRYLAIAGCNYVSPEAFKVRAPGKGGY